MGRAARGTAAYSVRGLWDAFAESTIGKREVEKPL
jgi:hypothetical protein